MIKNRVLAICQDCLRVISTDYESGMKKKCECGGDFCCCLNCQTAACLLIIGERNPVKIGLNPDKAAECDLKNWNYKTGIE